MKKIIIPILCVILCAAAFSGCAGNTQTGDGKISVVVTVFPQYDWVRNIIGDKASEFDLTLLLDNGVDLHSYRPTADDIIKITDCDILIYVGGESDGWLDDILKKNENKKMTTVNLLKELGDKAVTEELKEGMQGEEEGEEEEEEYDEHIWLSLKNAAVLCPVICDAVCKADAENRAIYEQNTDKYVGELKALDEKYKAAVDSSSVKTLLFGDRFPFRYMTNDYGLDYYAAFIGCSAESEASFETIMFLANKVDELSLKSICKIENSDGKIAETIKTTAKTTDISVVTFDSMQSTTMLDINNGVTYLSVMEKNLTALKEALKQEAK